MYKYKCTDAPGPIRSGCQIIVFDKSLTLKNSNENQKIAGMNLGGISTGMAPLQPLIDHNSLTAAMAKRISPVMPKPDPQVLKRLKLFTEKVIHKFFKPLDSITDDDFATWLRGHGSYNNRRKLELYTAYKSLPSTGDSWIMEEFEEARLKLPAHMREVKPLTYKDLICKSFIKVETYSDRKLPRFIQQRSDRAKAAIAVAISKIEEQVFHGKLNHFVKGMNWNDIPGKILTNMPDFKYYYVTDYSSFESGFSHDYTKAVEQTLFDK